ncbi:MAG: glycoside hydrolase family 43 [Polyangiaceae bacterium]|nr:glycoside hydrolase family 43 [Polyangiaceae bacterium]
MSDNGERRLRRSRGRRWPTNACDLSSDDFESPELGRQWQWHANHEPHWFSLGARPRPLRLFARPVLNGDLADTPNLLLQKLPARAFTVTTTVELAGHGERAGLVVMGKSHAALAVQRSLGQQLLTLSINNARLRGACPGGRAAPGR